MKISDIEVEYKQHCGNDLSVVNAARVSFHKESDWAMPSCQMMESKDIKLVQYLAKHKHTSPFNHSFITLRVKAPIFVARQLVKHKFMPWNEVSRRYVDDEPEFYFPGEGNWRHKAENVKQGSGETGAKLKPLYDGQEDLWADVDNQFDPDIHVSAVVYDCLRLYKDMIDSGVAAEQARMILPQNTMTEWWWSGTLGAWADMLRLRLDPHAQYETRLVAEKARAIIQPLFPVSLPALLHHD
jgi:thymidylate synthase (FAD)